MLLFEMLPISVLLNYQSFLLTSDILFSITFCIFILVLICYLTFEFIISLHALFIHPTNIIKGSFRCSRYCREEDKIPALRELSF